MTADEVTHIVVHCSRTGPEDGPGYMAVERRCRKRGALSCGYHYVIERGGIIKACRPLDTAGNHLLGHNDSSLAICLVGMPGTFRAAQKKALGLLLGALRHDYPQAALATHESLDPKTAHGCPGIPLATLQGMVA